MKNAMGILGLLLICVSVGNASPTQVGTFTGTDSFNFLSLSNGTLISNQFAGSHGVTFSSLPGGGLYATAAYQPYSGFAITAANFNASCQCDDITLTFGSPVSEVGFIGWTQNQGSATFTDTHGSVTIPNIQGFPTFTPFIGIEDASGISSLTISDVGVNNAFLFTGVTENRGATPEPSTFLLLGTGLTGLLGAVRRKLKA